MDALSTAYVPSKAFVQNKGGQALENYIANILFNLLASNNNIPLAYKVKQHIPKILNMTINYLNHADKKTLQTKYAAQIKI